MKKIKNKIHKKKSPSITVKTGRIDSFFSTVKEVMRAADNNETIKKKSATLTFVDPTDMLHFLSAEKN